MDTSSSPPPAFSGWWRYPVNRRLLAVPIKRCQESVSEYSVSDFLASSTNAKRKLDASHEQSLARLPLELLNFPDHPHQLCVPIDPVPCSTRRTSLPCRIAGRVKLSYEEEHWEDDLQTTRKIIAGRRKTPLSSRTMGSRLATTDRRGNCGSRLSISPASRER